MQQKRDRQERLKALYKRDLDRKEKCANELRKELNDAKCQLNAIEYGAKKAERNIDVTRQEHEREQNHMKQSMAKQVGKVARLLANVRVVRATGSRREANLAAGNRVRSSIFLFARLLCSFACTLQALQHQVVRVKARKKEANKLKRQANKKIKKQTRQSGQTQQQAHAAIEITDEPAEYV